MLNLYVPAAAPEPHFQPGCGRCIFDFATICKKKQFFFSWSHMSKRSRLQSQKHIWHDSSTPWRPLISSPGVHLFPVGSNYEFASYFSASLLGFFLSRRLIYFFSQLRCCALFSSRGKKHCTCFEKTSTSQLCNCHSDLLSFRWPHGSWFHHLHSSELSHDSGLHCCLLVSWLLHHSAADWTYTCEK